MAASAFDYVRAEMRRARPRSVPAGGARRFFPITAKGLGREVVTALGPMVFYPMPARPAAEVVRPSAWNSDRPMTPVTSEGLRRLMLAA